MKQKSIELLNKAVADELSAVHQYMYFHFHCEDQAFELLSGLFERTAIEEMQHVELLAERIIFLGGDVEMVASGEVEKVQDVAKMLDMAIHYERERLEVLPAGHGPRDSGNSWERGWTAGIALLPV